MNQGETAQLKWTTIWFWSKQLPKIHTHTWSRAKQMFFIWILNNHIKIIKFVVIQTLLLSLKKTQQQTTQNKKHYNIGSLIQACQLSQIHPSINTWDWNLYRDRYKGRYILDKTPAHACACLWNMWGTLTTCKEYLKMPWWKSETGPSLM